MSAGPIPPIALHALAAGSGGARYGLLLLVMMRVIAVLWIAEGLQQWSVVLAGRPDAWNSLSPPAQIALVFFAVIQPVAAVGLWLRATWGGVIWLVSAGAQCVVSVVIVDVFAHPVLIDALDVLLSAVYLGLMWLASREAETAPS